MFPSQWQNEPILRKKKLKPIDKATNASVKKEMAQPRMAKSVRVADLTLGKARVLASANS